MYKIIVRKNYKDCHQRYYKPGDFLEDNGTPLAFDTITDTVAYIKKRAGEAIYDDRVLDWWPEIGGGDK